MPKTIATMPPEVIQIMLKNMHPWTQVAFISTCKALYRTHSLDVLLANLQRLANKKKCVLLALAPKKTLVRRRVEYATYPDAEGEPDDMFSSEVDDADDALMVPGSAKYKTIIEEDWVIEPSHELAHALVDPFVLVGAAYTPARDDITLQVAFPEYKASSAKEVEVIVEGHEIFFSQDFEEAVQQLWLRLNSGPSGGSSPAASISESAAASDSNLDSDSDSDADSGRPRRLEAFSYSYLKAMQTGGFFERITSPGAMRRWWMYNCWECSGQRTVCPGCGGFGERWPEARTGCGYNMPCPMCVGYGAAQDARRMFYEDERMVDEELNVAPVVMHLWSKETWEASEASKAASA